MHSKDNNAWGLWGDDATERMSNITANYQAPYRYYTVTPSFLEPQGDPIADPTSASQNTTDFVTFCTDCHDESNTINSTRLGRPLAKINWTINGDKHGGKASRDVNYNKGTIKLPYVEASATNYVLSCLDCHEPHGSQNAFLLRTEVNGVVISGAISASDNSNGAWTNFCEACHTVTLTGVGTPCNGGHGPGPWPNKACYNCHKHSSYTCPVNSTL
jgi:cytochrome c553